MAGVTKQSTVTGRYLPDEEATVAFAKQLAAAVDEVLSSTPDPVKALMVYLEGDLGAGKTTLARGLLRAMGHQGAVKSPTYTLVEPYESLKFAVYHFDLYRLSDPEEVEFLGVETYFEAGNLCLVEWPGQGKGVLPCPDLEITMLQSGAGRQVCWHGVTETGQKLEQRLSDRMAICGE